MHRHVRVRVYENHLVVCYGTTRIQAMPRLTGQALHAIDYRHVIWSLVQKPGALARYRYREALFPTLVFRRTYERLPEASQGIRLALRQDAHHLGGGALTRAGTTTVAHPL
jgi:hypothetical protein